MVTFFGVGQGKEQDLHDIGERGAIADHDLENVRQVAHEENEGEERATYERVGENLTEDVTGQDAHRIALCLVYLAGAVDAGVDCQPRRRKLLASTQTELSAMAAAAIHGLSRMWKAG